jgi:hypothetical protein
MTALVFVPDDTEIEAPARDDNYVSDTHQWRLLSEIKPGDFIHRWGDDLEVLSIAARKRGGFKIIVRETDGSERTWKYDRDGQYICKRR